MDVGAIIMALPSKILRNISTKVLFAKEKDGGDAQRIKVPVIIKAIQYGLTYCCYDNRIMNINLGQVANFVRYDYVITIMIGQIF